MTVKNTNTKDPVLAKAIEWLVLLQSGQGSTADVAAHQAWRNADPAHEAASQRIERALGSMDILKAHGVSAALVRTTMSRASRRPALRSGLALVGLGAGVGAGMLGWRMVGDAGLLADRHTGIAQRLQAPLADGSTLLLDARTAVDVQVDATTCSVVLHGGRLLAKAATDPRGPLQVQTRHGSVSGDDAQFIVQVQELRMLVTALKGSLTLRPPEGKRVSLPEGWRAALATGSQPEVTAARGTEALWTRGVVALDNEPLGDLIDALQPYRAGILRIEPSAARLRISGIFSLDDTDRTLRALAETQPVRIAMRTPYWVTISSV